MLVHVAARGARRGHPPGAVLVEPQARRRHPARNREPADAGRLQALLERLGYRPDLNIVAYDDEGGGWAGGSSGRST